MGFSFPDDRPAWDVWFCASSEDLWKEFLWASRRPESRANGLDQKWESLCDFEKDLQNPSKANEMREEFLQCLTTVENGFLSFYRCERPGVCYSLNQNPEHCATDSTYATLHTVIRNAGVIWPLVF